MRLEIQIVQILTTKDYALNVLMGLTLIIITFVEPLAHNVKISTLFHFNANNAILGTVLQMVNASYKKLERKSKLKTVSHTILTIYA